VYAAVTVLHLIYVVPVTRYMGAEGTIISMIVTELFGVAAFALLYFRDMRPLAQARAQGLRSVTDEQAGLKSSCWSCKARRESRANGGIS